MDIEELGLWLSALIVAEDEADGPLVQYPTPFMTLVFPEDFDFYCEWYNTICDEIEGRAKNTPECV